VKRSLNLIRLQLSSKRSKPEKYHGRNLRTAAGKQSKIHLYLIPLLDGSRGQPSTLALNGVGLKLTQKNPL
ncbi:hypothetical protein, partial [Streptococcus pneumoniae]|uniref:hypothetical protein n=1 Tax=Streptococcus pneumoniae TaxID=1313 RepID=UPI001E53BB5E